MSFNSHFKDELMVKMSVKSQTAAILKQQLFEFSRKHLFHIILLLLLYSWRKYLGCTGSVTASFILVTALLGLAVSSSIQSDLQKVRY